MSSAIRRMPERLLVLAVQADEEAHAAVRQALAAIERPYWEIHWVTTPAAALAALDEHPHDAIVVSHDLRDPLCSGLQLATRMLEHTPHAPILLLDDDAPDRDTDLRASEAGIAGYLAASELTPATLERALRYAVAHQRTLSQLTESEERYALALQAGNDGLWDWDVTNDRLYFSPHVKALLGYRDHEIGDAPGEWLGRVHPDERAELTQAFVAHLMGTVRPFEHEHRIRHADGAYRWFHARGMAVRDRTGRATRVVGSISDVSDRKAQETRLQHDALHDALTGLPNRVLFLDRLEQAMRRAQREGPPTAAAVLFLDLDRFKLVNDSLGHQVGDRLLTAVARRLEAALRPGDTVARLGGDEFTVLLDGVSGDAEAAVVADRIQETVREPFAIDGRELFVDASIGIALAPQDAQPADVVRDADVAMYRAKADGKGRHALFDARMHEQVVRRMDAETALRRAIEEDRLEVLYQPIVQTATGRIAGFEALVRWPDEGGALAEPADFLPIAEETGLIVPLGRWVLETACAQAADWRATAQGAGLTIGVNVSHRQIVEPGFVDALGQVLSLSELDPRALRLEVKEQDLAADADGMRRALAAVNQVHGVRSHIDDFGTGAASLRLLHRFPGDAVKVYRGLVHGMDTDASAFEIVKALVALAHNLGLEVIAQGVETPSQLAHLRTLGCEFAQGFQLGAPLRADDAAALLRDGVVTVE